MSTEVAIAKWTSSEAEYQRKLGNFVQYFQVNVPTDGYGIPTRIVDPTALAPHLLDCASTDDISDVILEKALIPVEFDDALPLVDGVPLWERLDGERVEYYKLFKEYREDLYVKGSRAISKLAERLGVPGARLSILAKAYHWQLRCKAYDKHKVWERERARQFEIMKLESTHSKMASRLMEQSMEFLEKHPQQLTHKAALQMLEIGYKMGRVALGLNADKPGSGSGGAGNQIHIHQSTLGAQEVHNTVEVAADKVVADSADISQLQSVLHILQKTGAFKEVQEPIDAEFTVVEE